MTIKRKSAKPSTEKSVRDIRRTIRCKYSAEESIAKLCCKEGINTNVYCRWSKDFLGAGRKRLTSDTVRDSLM